LWDPWETHYAEVAREILARRDWITLWSHQEQWFWSKPVGIFWSEALTMKLLAVPFWSDANPPHPEWAIRLPSYLWSLGTLCAIYTLMAQTWSKRRGLLCMWVLLSMPMFFFEAHQAATDMPLVGALTIAVCLLVLALNADPRATVRRYRVGSLYVSAAHVVSTCIVLVALPQITYLFSRNIVWRQGSGIRFVRDHFTFGSAGNGAIPGNPALAEVDPAYPQFFLQPAAQALFWSVLLVWLLLSLRREQNRRRLYMVGFYFFCACAFLAKGLLGIVLPGLIALLYLLTTAEWSLLLRGHLQIGRGILIVSIISLPWYVAMVVRHGYPFIDRILIYDHLNRLTEGVHGDTGDVSYFISQLSYAAFPWLPFVALALMLIWRTPSPQNPRAASQRRTQLLITLWLVATFVLISSMVTKFHHYVFITLPALACWVGIALDSAWASSRRRGALWTWVVVGCGAAALILGLSSLKGDVRGLISSTSRLWSPTTQVTSIVLGLCLFGFAAWRLRGTLSSSLSAKNIAPALLIGVAIGTLVTQELSSRTVQRPYGDERLMQLFTYMYSRAWPDSADYRAPLWGFGAMFCALGIAFISKWRRPLSARAILMSTYLFLLWGTHVYLGDLTPHWSQQRLIKRYYAQRKGKHEPLIAWQMNWLGEYFYTGNHVTTFVEVDNGKVLPWIATQRGKKAFVILLHDRLDKFKTMLAPRQVTKLSTMLENNKFVLVSVKL